MKVNTISLNSVRLNTIALNHIGEIRSGGGGSKPSPIPQWIREHVVFYYDVKKQGATNETLKESAYLQDLSGKGRRMKLNNFLFAEMSGVDGYNENFSKFLINQNEGTVKIESSSSFVIQAIKMEHVGIVYRYVDNEKIIIKCNITGITEEIKGKFAFGYADATGINNIILENGYFEFISSEHEGLNGWCGFKAMRPIDNCNITITQIPEYPGALVTDGVDDYGLVENLSSGVKMLFMTVNPIGDFNASKAYYAQSNINKSFWVRPIRNAIAYNSNNPNGVTYIDGMLNKSIYCQELFNVKHTITIVNGTVDSTNTVQPVFFANEHRNSGYFSKLAFYNSIAFDSIPTEADGFTEQELIDYVLTNIIGQ